MPRPEQSLRTFLLDNFALLFHRSTGSTLFSTMHQIVNTGRLFVQDKISSTECNLDASAIFALFVFGLDSNIQRFCVQAMRNWQAGHADFGNDTLVQWSPLIYHTDRALRALPELRTVLFRSIEMSKEEVFETLRERHVGAIFKMHPFMSCTPDLRVVTSWCSEHQEVQDAGKLGQGCDAPKRGIIYKILPGSGARDISPFTLHKWQSEAVFLMGTQFRVVRHLHIDVLHTGQLAQSDLLCGGLIDTSFCRPSQLPKVTMQNVPDIAVIELEELRGADENNGSSD
jgi:hypothetical protein